MQPQYGIFKETKNWKASLMVLAQNQFVASGLHWLGWTCFLRFCWQMPELHLEHSLSVGKLKFLSWLWVSRDGPQCSIGTEYCICHNCWKEGYILHAVWVPQSELCPFFPVSLDVSYSSWILSVRHKHCKLLQNDTTVLSRRMQGWLLCLLTTGKT